MQRWLIRSSARNMRREITGEMRRRIGSDRAGQDDVWAVAVTEPRPDAAEAPECAWCPVCRAARKIRERQGLGGQLSGAGEAVAAAVQEAFGAFDGLLARSGQGTRPGAGGGASGSGTRPGAAGRDGGAGASGSDPAPGGAPGRDGGARASGSAARPSAATGRDSGAAGNPEDEPHDRG
jgi:hypothetical protein